MAHWVTTISKSCASACALAKLRSQIKSYISRREGIECPFRFADGKIASVREYLDTQHPNDVWATAMTDEEMASVSGG